MNIAMWRSGGRPLTGPRIAIDTETELIVDHRTPPLVLLQVYNGGDTVHLVKWQDADEYIGRLSAECPKSRVVFHNAPFDISVLGGHRWLEEGVEDGRIGDTMLRFALWKLSTTGDYASLSLATAARDVMGMTLDKSEDVRLTFSRDMIEPDDAHKEYAAADVIATWRLDEAIPRSGTQTEETQVKAAMALYDISKLGMAVDEQRRAKLEDRFNRKLEDTLEILDANGYVPGRPGNKLALQTALKQIEVMHGVTLPRTEKKGDISVSKEAMAEMSEDIPFLSALKNHDHYNKILSTYLRKGVAGGDGRVHTRFNTIIKTGRTSSSKPNLQQLPRAEGVRGMYVPAPGYVFSATDYSQLELCALAQHCKTTYGKSELAEVINSGVDVHKFLASKIYNVEVSQVTKDQRQLAKAASFGFLYKYL